MRYYNSKFLDLLSLDNSKKYSRKFLFQAITKKKSFFSIKYKYKNDLWIISPKIINLLIDLDIDNEVENKSFYDLLYIHSPKKINSVNNWRRCLKYGFDKKKIYQIIDSFNNLEVKIISFYQKGNCVKLIEI